MQAPLGVATYFTEALPDELKGCLPTIAELENTFPPLTDEERTDD